MKKLILVLGLLAVVAWLIGVMSDDDEVSLPEQFSDASADREPAVSSAVQERLAYLGDPELAEEVAWYEIVGNNVYIGVKLRGELESLINPAAFWCHQALGRGCHAWAVDASVAGPDWTPSDPGFICEATARYGKVEDSSCRGR